MRTAVILLTLLALAAVPGSLLPQRNVASDPFAVTTFVAEHPRVSPWLDRLSLFDVYASPWFAGIYILLLVSMVGCVLPRSLRLWRAAQAPPPPSPSNLRRLEHYATAPVDDAWRTLAAAEAHLRKRGFRVVRIGQEVRAEKGYAREAANLVFHLSLLVLLVGIAGGKLFGFEGRVALAEGASFTNVRSEYDAFTPSALTDVDDLEPVSITLTDFEAEFEASGTKVGEPRAFSAAVDYQRAGKPTRDATIRPNHPLDVDGTKFFLTGHGYAPRVTVRDGEDAVVFSGPVIFLPSDGSFTSDGVIKAPAAQPTQLAFEGVFLPTAAPPIQGDVSLFPGPLAPRLVLTAYTGDVGLGDGTPQSVYTLDKSGLTAVTDGRLSVGETLRLPRGQGSITFDGVERFANFQVNYDPGKEITLVAALLLLGGLTASLTTRRRRLWLRVTTSPEGGQHLDVAALSLTRRAVPPAEVSSLLEALATTHSSRLERIP